MTGYVKPVHFNRQRGGSSWSFGRLFVILLINSSAKYIEIEHLLTILYGQLKQCYLQSHTASKAIPLN